MTTHKHLSLHDHFFRSAMAEPKVIQEFFQKIFTYRNQKK